MSLRVALRRAWTRFLQRREALATREALRVLDDLALRDLGVRRGEIDSLAAEAAGLAARMRRRLRAAKGS